jgi:D-alanine-D-alanine ligase
MEKKLCVAVIFGGRSGEHEVSLMSARSVLSALDPQKYEVVQIGITKDGIWLSGENALEALSKNDVNAAGLKQVFIIPDRFHNSIWELQIAHLVWMMEPFAKADVACSSWLILPMSAQA